MSDAATDHVPMTVWGVPLADVFAEWHRRWKEEPDEYYSWAESIARPSEEYGPAAVRTMLAIAREMSPWINKGGIIPAGTVVLDGESGPEAAL